MSLNCSSRSAHQVHEGLIISTILTLVKNSAVYTRYSDLALDWKTLATALNVSNESITSWQTSTVLNKLQPLDVVQSILVNWKLRAGESSSLKDLQKALEHIPGWEDILHAVKEKKNQPLATYSWETLTFADMSELLSKVVTFFGRKQSLLSIASKVDEQRFFQIMRNLVSNAELQALIESSVYNLTTNSIPSRPSWYISRSLMIHSRVDLASLSNCSDIFLVTGLDLEHLSGLLKIDNIQKSGDQLKELSTNFIILEDSSHFQMICKKTKAYVHVINYQNNCMHWVKTRGNITSIIANARGSRDSISESEFISTHLFCHNSLVVCITDNLGAGKRELLYSLARELYVNYPDRIVICISLAPLLKELTALYKPINCTNIITEISKLVSANTLGAKLCTEVVSNRKNMIELVLQGYDYALPSQIPFANKIIKELVINRSNFRIYVSSRSKNSFDPALNQHILYCRTAPFNTSERQQLLESYMKHRGKVNILDATGISQIAQRLTNMMAPETSNQHKDIVGFPLYAGMLVDFLANKTLDFTSELQKFLHFSPSIYEVLCEYVKSRWSSKNRSDHIKIALMTLCPVESIDLNNKVFSKGRLGIGSSNLLTDNGIYLQFRHQIIAEFLLADSLADQLLETSCALQTFCTQNDLSLNTILVFMFKTEAENDNSICFTRNSLPFFLNAKLELTNVCNDHKMTNKIREAISNARVLSSLPIDKILKVCAKHEYNSLFCVFVDCYTTDLKNNSYSLSGLQSEDWTFVFLRICRYGTLNLIRQTCTVASSQIADCPKDLSDGQVSPLHLSARRGSLENFTFFWPIFEKSGPNLQGLVHATVQNTHNLLKKDIIERTNLIDFLIESLGKDVLFEELSNLPQPIVMSNIHLDLIKKLIIVGADPFAVDADKNNLAHITASYLDPDLYHSLVAFLLNKWKGIFKCRNLSNETPIYVAFKYMTLKDETIKLLIQAKEIDMSSNVGHQDTFLYNLIKRGYTVPLIRLALKFSPDWTDMVYKDKSTTLLHVAAQWGSTKTILYLLKAGAKVNRQDVEGRTALHDACIALAVKQVPTFNINAAIEELTNSGADTNVLDKYGKDPLWYIKGAE